MGKKIEATEWMGHVGEVLASDNGFDVIDCQQCGFKHITPIPTVDELESVYKHDYYEEEKPLYLDRYLEDIDWWNVTYNQRYEIFEKHHSSRNFGWCFGSGCMWRGRTKRNCESTSS